MFRRIQRPFRSEITKPLSAADTLARFTFLIACCADSPANDAPVGEFGILVVCYFLPENVCIVGQFCTFLH
jgi:hypothetical protein